MSKGFLFGVFTTIAVAIVGMVGGAQEWPLWSLVVSAVVIGVGLAVLDWMTD